MSKEFRARILCEKIISKRAVGREKLYIEGYYNSLLDNSSKFTDQFSRGSAYICMNVVGCGLMLRIAVKSKIGEWRDENLMFNMRRKI